MILTQLTVKNFRNYEALELDFAPGLSVFTGRNAQGKTNLLEAIHVLCTGRSHRTARDKEMIRHDGDMSFAERAYIAAICRQRDGDHQLEVALTHRGRKAVRVNGSSITRLGELMGHMNAVMFSPEDLNLIKDGPAWRRRFMDMTLSQAKGGYFFLLQRYQRALLQRNELLKLIQREGRGEETMEIWEAQLAEAGAALSLRRGEFAAFLSENARKIHGKLTSGQEELEISYESALEGSQQQRQQQLAELLLRNRQRDIRLGATTAGPHRDDLAVRINGADARSDASQGQRRTAVLSMKLSELKLMEKLTGEAPILLLDDVFSELDGARRDMLQDYIGRVQTFITCVDLESLALRAGAARQYRVEKGRVTPIDL